MSKREGDVAKLAHLLPVLLQSIKDVSGLGYEELYRRLGPAMALAPGSLKRNWLRWKAVSDRVDEKGRLAHSDSLRRLVEAATEFGWISEDSAGASLPLLMLLKEREQNEREEQRRAVQRRMSRLRKEVRSVIREQRETAYDDRAWLSAVCGLVGEEVARELRRRLLGGADGLHGMPADAGDDLLAGHFTQSVKNTIQQVREAAIAPLLGLEVEFEHLEKRAVAGFNETVNSAPLDGL